MHFPTHRRATRSGDMWGQEEQKDFQSDESGTPQSEAEAADESKRPKASEVVSITADK